MRGTPQPIPLEEGTPPPIGESSPDEIAAPDPSASVDPAAGNGTQGLEHVHVGSGQVFGDTPLGIPYSSVFKNTGGSMDSLTLPPKLHAEAKTDSETGKFSVSLPNVVLPRLRAALPLHRAFAPADADLKLGPVYLKLRELSGALLASDNINLEETNRDSGAIAAVRLGMTVIAQLSEGLQFALAGTITYLPFKGEVGIGPSRDFPAAFLLGGLNYEPLLTSQVAYETMLAGWPVVFADDLHVANARFYNANPTRDDFEIFDPQRPYTDRAGRYYFTAPRTSFGKLNTDGIDPDFRNKDLANVAYLSNVVSAATNRLVATDARAAARAYHENIWYFNYSGRGLPAWRDVVKMELASERESLRFKPFVGYEALKTDQMREFDHSFYAGIRGPITDQLLLLARTELVHRSAGNSYFWRLQLNHTAGPYTTESLSYARELSDFHETIHQALEYRLSQVLGPNLLASFYAEAGKLENRFGDSFSQDDFRSGLLLSYNMSPKTDMSLGLTYSKLSRGSENEHEAHTWTARYRIRHQFTDTLSARLMYQYQQLDSNRDNESYFENLVLFVMTKEFE